MAQLDIAQRVYNHAWKPDPIVRSLLDTDFYKLLMLQMIWARYRDVRATFAKRKEMLHQRRPVQQVRQRPPACENI